MTRSIFDPTGGETEHSGSRYLPPHAENNSHMPPDVVDGRANEEGSLEAQTHEGDNETAFAEPTATPAQDEAGAVPEDGSDIENYPA